MFAIHGFYSLDVRCFHTLMLQLTPCNLYTASRNEHRAVIFVKLHCNINYSRPTHICKIKIKVLLSSKGEHLVMVIIQRYTSIYLFADMYQIFAKSE